MAEWSEPCVINDFEGNYLNRTDCANRNSLSHISECLFGYHFYNITLCTLIIILKLS